MQGVHFSNKCLFLLSLLSYGCTRLFPPMYTPFKLPLLISNRVVVKTFCSPFLTVFSPFLFTAPLLPSSVLPRASLEHSTYPNDMFLCAFFFVFFPLFSSLIFYFYPFISFRLAFPFPIRRSPFYLRIQLWTRFSTSSLMTLDFRPPPSPPSPPRNPKSRSPPVEITPRYTTIQLDLPFVHLSIAPPAFPPLLVLHFSVFIEVL